MYHHITHSETSSTSAAKPLSRGSQAGSSIAKIASVACFSVVLFLGVFSTGDTMSFFLSEQSSLNDTFTADPLYFSVSASSTSITLDGHEQMIVTLMTQGTLSEPLQYSVTATTTTGDPTLCASIELLGTAPFVYDGPLLALQSATTTQTGPWALMFSLAPGSNVAPGSTCSVDLIYTGWNASAVTGQGYTDTERLSLTFSTPTTTSPVIAPETSAPNTPDTPPTVDASMTTDSSSTPPTTVTDESSTPDTTTVTDTTTDTSITTTPAPDSSTQTLPTDTTAPAITDTSSLPASTNTTQ